MDYSVWSIWAIIPEIGVHCMKCAVRKCLFAVYDTTYGNVCSFCWQIRDNYGGRRKKDLLPKTVHGVQRDTGESQDPRNSGYGRSINKIIYIYINN